MPHNELILWDKTELSKRIGRSSSSISKDIMQNRIPHVKIGRLVRFRPADIAAWIEGQAREAR